MQDLAGLQQCLGIFNDATSTECTSQHTPQDINAIEHAWDMLKVVIAQRPNPPDTLQDLTEADIEEWDLLHQDQLDSLIQSMLRRVEELIRVRGEHSHY